MSMGRPPVFETPKEMLDAWIKYKEDCKAKDEPISKLGFCVSLGYHRSLFDNYKNRKKDAKDFNNILEHIKRECKHQLINKALKNEYNSAIAKLVLSANYDMHEKSKQETSGEITVNIGNEDKDL